MYFIQVDDTTAFLRAARSGNLEKVIEFLDTDLDINTANSVSIRLLITSNITYLSIDID